MPRHGERAHALARAATASPAISSSCRSRRPLGAFAFLPLCQARRGNVIVDTFTARLRPARHALARCHCGISLYAAHHAASSPGGSCVGARDAFASQTTSMVLGIPHGYAIAACAVMGVFLALVAVVDGGRVCVRSRPVSGFAAAGLGFVGHARADRAAHAGRPRHAPHRQRRLHLPRQRCRPSSTT